MKVFLAGTSGETKNKELASKPIYLLESFYYIQQWQYPLIHSTKMFLLDSGAFTFFSSGKKVDWEQYVKKYADFINEHDVKYFFELDVDSLIGYKNVLALRNQLEMMTGKKCIPVWHKSRGLEEFKKMCDEYPYVAIGGIASKELTKKDYKYFPYLINEAHKRGAKIHGLGFTCVSEFGNIKFDSVDSTRWNCARFGRIEYFDGKTMKSIDKRKQGKRLVGRKNNNIIEFTFNEWIKFQKYADKYL